MIGRETVQTLTSIQDVDVEITNRQSRLNELGRSIEPQIISEEIVELRMRRSEIEEQMVQSLSRSTGVSTTQCRLKLLQHRWNMKATMENMTFIRALDPGCFFGEYGHKYHLCRGDYTATTITAICGHVIHKRGGYKENVIVLQDNVCPLCIELGMHTQGVENVKGSVRALPEVS